MSFMRLTSDIESKLERDLYFITLHKSYKWCKHYSNYDLSSCQISMDVFDLYCFLLRNAYKKWQYHLSELRS